jgi:hypothetical protein
VFYSSGPIAEKPIKGVDFPPESRADAPSSPIPRRQKVVEANGASTELPQLNTSNGNGTVAKSAESGKKRTFSDVEDAEHQTKRSKTGSNETVVLDDAVDGAILIDDD